MRPTSVKELDEVTVKVLSDEGGGGSGVIYNSSSKGTVVLTNAHVCEVIQTGGIVLKDKAYFITGYKKSKQHDLCYVRISENLRINTVISKSAPPKYTKVFISGHPNLYPQVVSEGYVSSNVWRGIAYSSRACTKEEYKENPVDCIFEGHTLTVRREATLVSALISPGSSGSGVFNKQGEIVGLAFAGRDNLGYALVVPWNYLDRFIKKEAKSLKWEKPGPDKFVKEYENPGYSDINNWRKLFKELNKRKK